MQEQEGEIPRAGLNSFFPAIDRTRSRCVISFPPAAAVSQRARECCVCVCVRVLQAAPLRGAFLYRGLSQGDCDYPGVGLPGNRGCCLSKEQNEAARRTPYASFYRRPNLSRHKRTYFAKYDVSRDVKRIITFYWKCKIPRRIRPVRFLNASQVALNTQYQFLRRCPFFLSLFSSLSRNDSRRFSYTRACKHPPRHDGLSRNETNCSDHVRGLSRGALNFYRNISRVYVSRI